MLRLTPPDIRYRDSYVAALREGLHLQAHTEEEILLAEKDFDAYLRHRFDLSRPVILPDGKRIPRLPMIDFWLVDEAKFIAISSFRPQLNDALLKRGGNLGYAVRASERRKGYGKIMLQMMLKELKSRGLTRVLITCHDQNEGSIRVIESAGGVLQDKVSIEGIDIPERRYWITL